MNNPYQQIDGRRVPSPRQHLNFPSDIFVQLAEHP